MLPRRKGPVVALCPATLRTRLGCRCGGRRDRPAHVHKAIYDPMDRLGRGAAGGVCSVNYTESLPRCYYHAAPTTPRGISFFLWSFKFCKDTKSSVLILLIDSKLCRGAYTIRRKRVGKRKARWGGGGDRGGRKQSGSPWFRGIIMKLSYMQVNRDAESALLRLRPRPPHLPECSLDPRNAASHSPWLYYFTLCPFLDTIILISWTHT